MKTILVMRHAKSSWSEPGVGDHGRSLNQRGLRDAPAMGRWLVQQQCLPDWIACSDAKRAKTTANLLLESSDVFQEIHSEIVPEFYHAGPNTYLEYASKFLPVEVERVMVIGHNPGLEILIAQLTDEFETMPTAAIAVIRLSIEDWSEIVNQPDAELLDIWRPKEVLR